METKIWWYVARAAGMTTLALLAASTIWGLLLTTRVIQARTAPRWLADLHRFLGELTLVFAIVHLGGLAADGYLEFGPAELFVPFASSWRPGAVAWGIVGWWLLVVIAASSWAMRRIPRRAWTLIHRTSFVALWTGAVHAAAAGSDVTNVVYRWVVVVTTAVVVALTLFRVVVGRRSRRTGRRGTASAGRETGRAAPGRVVAAPLPGRG